MQSRPYDMLDIVRLDQPYNRPLSYEERIDSVGPMICLILFFLTNLAIDNYLTRNALTE